MEVKLIGPLVEGLDPLFVQPRVGVVLQHHLGDEQAVLPRKHLVLDLAPDQDQLFGSGQLCEELHSHVNLRLVLLLLVLSKWGHTYQVISEVGHDVEKSLFSEHRDNEMWATDKARLECFIRFCRDASAPIHHQVPMVLRPDVSDTIFGRLLEQIQLTNIIQGFATWDLKLSKRHIPQQCKNEEMKFGRFAEKANGERARIWSNSLY